MGLTTTPSLNNGQAEFVYDAAGIARHLDKPLRSGNGWKAFCPAHDGNSQALALTDGPDGKVLAHCHAGCPQEAVIDALRERGLWPEKREKPRRSRKRAGPPGKALVREWGYENTAGVKVVTRRTDWPGTKKKKRILQHPPGVEPPFLPLIRRPSDGYEGPLVVTEGEVAADAVLEAGYAACSWIGGSKRVHKTEWDGIRGDVVLWPDADDPGRKCMTWLAAKLAAKCSVRMVDVSDMNVGADAVDVGLETLHAMIKEAGEPPEPAPGELPQEGFVIQIDPEGFQTALDHFGWRVRTNTLTDQEEWDTGKGWEPAKRRRNRWMREQIRERFSTPGHGDKLKPAVFGRGGRWDDVVGYLAHENQVDPLAEYLESLPPWDGGKRLDFIFSEHFGAEDTPLSRWASGALFLTVVKRLREPGAKGDEVAVLQGPPGCGKTAFVEGALPPSLRDYVGKIDLSSNKKAMESVDGALVCEIGEGHWLTRADIAVIKDFISQRNDGVARGAYALSKEPKWRRCAILVTADHDNPLPNDPNLRRWVVVKLAHGCHVEAMYEADRDQLWAEAVHRIDAGGSPRLPRTLHDEAHAIAVQHRSTDFALEDAIEKAFGEAPFTYLRPMELQEALADYAKHLPRGDLYNTLSAMGYESRNLRWVPGGAKFRAWHKP